eukprot:scaffold37028_cov57-Attheya_sp.AAC.8
MTPDTGASDKPAKVNDLAEDKKPAATGEYKRYFKHDSKKPTTNVSTPAIVKKPKSEGMIPELKGHIYDCTNARQLDLFVKTTKKILDYVGRELLGTVTMPEVQLSTSASSLN